VAKTKIALYGISANPITVGHELAARAVYAQCMDIDEVWISPCYNHQLGKRTAPADLRLRMCQEVVKDMGKGFKCWEWEHEKQFKGTTWDFANLAEHNWPEYEFSFVIGMDNAQVLKQTWDHGVKLIEKIPFIVVQRGHEQPTRGGWWNSDPHRTIKFQWPISSTEIREAIRDDNMRFLNRNIHPKVNRIINNHELYGYRHDDVQHGYGR
jgi:nicotinate (nicotinamide) nucleotide adenylyltransferase